MRTFTCKNLCGFAGIGKNYFQKPEKVPLKGEVFNPSGMDKNSLELPMTTLQNLFEKHLSVLACSSTDVTLEQYRTWTAHFWRHIGDKKPDEVSLVDVNDFMVARSKEVSGKTLRFFRTTILRFFVYLEDMGVIAKNPLVLRKLPKIVVVPPDIKAFTYEQYLAVLEAARKCDYSFAWREVCIVGWHTGLRISDICNLKWSEVDLQEKIITVVARKTRRFNKVLIIPMSDELYEMLKYQRENPKYPALLKNPFVFPDMCWQGVFSKRVADYHFKMILKAAGVPRDYSFHGFRHSFCSRLINAGVNILVVQSFTGQTLKVLQGYVRVSLDAKKEALRIATPKLELQTA